MAEICSLCECAPVCANLILIPAFLRSDSGDHHDGPGIGSVSLAAADQCDEWLSKLGYDVLAIGNHELYRYEVTRDVWRGQKRWNGRYLTSNVNITVDGISQPVGKQYIKFETATGRRVTAFGVLYACKSDAKSPGRGLIFAQSRPILREAKACA